MRSAVLVFTLVACRTNETASVDKLGAQTTDIERRLAAIEARGTIDTAKVATELLAKGSAAGLTGPQGPLGP
jgi:hypothetical protein